ncbi:uncharacterized protein LOC124458353 [Xenia sp. Carnegie-2017]|uniref:uncharacterized protein LOC124458353 n=1 Tax=Xenia sp. Carnegie-2017 TaxID=2897299 RepID=UPI001F04B74F|nr:uncharacterized protein LOC124458353 [Xenia sp. Carnegie-2017]
MYTLQTTFHVITFVLSYKSYKASSHDMSTKERLECGSKITKENVYPRTCRFNKTRKPYCYVFKEDYGPIQHANGLCINLKDGSDQLIWSRDCSSASALFLMSHHYPPYHVITGKCVIPNTLEARLSDPKNADLTVRRSKYCGRPIGSYRPSDNGNLKYHHSNTAYEICIGSSTAGRNEWKPRENEKVTIRKNICQENNSCKFNYGTFCDAQIVGGG